MAGRESDRAGTRTTRAGGRADEARRRPRGGSRPRDGRPGRPVAAAERERDPARSRTVRAAAAVGLSTTRRAAVLAIVVCALALSVAVPLRTYLSQRDEVKIQEQRQADLRGQVEALGPDPDIDVLVFPIGALGRGVNCRACVRCDV